MSSLSLARHLHGHVEQRHIYSHGGLVFYAELPRWVSGFIKNVSLVEEWERINLCMGHTTLLCMLVCVHRE